MNNSKTQVLLAIVLHRFTNYILLGAIFLCLISYAVFANNAVRSVTTLQNSKAEREALETKVSDLESRSLSFEDKVSIEKAKSIGLKEVEKPVFIVKGSKTGQALSFLK